MNALRSKYKVRSDWLRKDPMKNVSHTWRAIERMKVLVSKGACCMVGDGVDIDVWKDPWVPCLEGYKPMPRNSMAEMGPLTVSSLINSTNRKWDIQKLNNLFNDDSVEAILKINLTRSARRDKLLWIKDPKGKFTVKSAFKAHQELGMPTTLNIN